MAALHSAEDQTNELFGREFFFFYHEGIMDQLIYEKSMGEAVLGRSSV